MVDEKDNGIVNRLPNHRSRIKYLLLYILLGAYWLAGGCGNKKVKQELPGESIHDSGSVQFWQMDTSRLAVTKVKIDTSIEMITLDTKKEPLCGTAGCAFFRLPPGRYVYYAWETQPGKKSWCDTIYIERGRCRNIKLR